LCDCTSICDDKRDKEKEEDEERGKRKWVRRRE